MKDSFGSTVEVATRDVLFQTKTEHVIETYSQNTSENVKTLFYSFWKRLEIYVWGRSVQIVSFKNYSFYKFHPGTKIARAALDCLKVGFFEIT